MDQRIKKYLITTSLLSNEECEKLDSFFDGKIYKNIQSNSFVFDILLNHILPLNFYKKIYEINNYSSTDFRIQIIQSTSQFNDQDLLDYFIFFINDVLQLQNQLNLVVSAKAINCENNTIIIQYFNQQEKQTLQNCAKQLEQLFHDAGFYFQSINITLDKNRQNESIQNDLMMSKINEMAKKSASYDIKLMHNKMNNNIPAKNVLKLNEINEPLKDCVVEGKIFKIEKSTTKKGFIIYSLSITDYESGLKLKAFIGNKKFYHSYLSEAYLDTFKENDWVRIQCSLSLDTYNNNQLVGSINKIQKIDIPKRFNVMDDAPKKRTELLMHTKMSVLDGIASIEEIYERAVKFGWNGIGIVDRNNVQSFPKAYSLSQKTGIKTAYGVEFDLLNENVTLANHTYDIPLKDCTYVVFDIETSGLNNEFDDLIEFAGLKVKNDQILDQIDFFIKPTQPISSYISQKTHITNEILNEQGKPIKESLKIIRDWIQDCVLIAHNGINFDYRFLNKKFIQNHMEPVNNPIIDTMQVSRLVNPDLAKHNLGVIAHTYHFEYNDAIAHRANFDTDVLYQVWKVMYERLQHRGITNLKQLQNIADERYWSRQFADNAIVLYPKTQSAFPVLYEMVSIATTKNLYGVPRLFTNEVVAHRNDFIIANTPTESNIFDLAINGSDQDLDQAINFYDVIFVPTVGQLNHLIANHEFSKLNAQKIIAKIIHHAKSLKKLVVAVSDGYYLDPYQSIGRKIYINSKLLGGKNHRLYTYEGDNESIPDNHLLTTNEMLEAFSFLKDEDLVNEIVIDNSHTFMSMIADHLAPLKSKLYPPIIEDVEQKLISYVNNQLKELYGDTPNELVKKRVDKELDSIISNGYSIVYWISHLLVMKSLEDGYLVGSRGSVGSSLVAYLLKITEVNPLPPHYICHHCHHLDFDVKVDDGFDLPYKKCPVCGNQMVGDGHNIPFETFLGFHGEKIPDIDLNFSGEYQAKAHEFIRTMFDANHTLRAGTIASVASKTAYGYVKNYYEKIDPSGNTNSTYIDWVTKLCSDVKRTTGQHPGGIIIVPKNMSIFDFTPYSYPADDKTSTWYTSHFTYDDLHNNLMKFDILGHDDPTKLKYLQDLTGVDPLKIPFYDPKVMSLFTSNQILNVLNEEICGEVTGAIGLPEFGTEFVRRILIDAQPKTFADLIRISGLSHGTNVWSNNAQDLIKKNHLTLSQVVSCRDDIMVNLMKQGVSDLTAFSTMESVRKGKGIKQQDLNELLSKNIPEWYIEACKKILYLFPKAHATAYVFNAWRIAWFKLYHPLAFYASYFTINYQTFDIDAAFAGKQAVMDKINYIRSAKQRNDINLKKTEEDKLSTYEVMLEMFARGFSFKNIDLKKSQAKKFILDDQGLIPPFGVINSCGEILAQKIITERAKKPFITKEDLIRRTSANKNVIAELEKFHVLDVLHEEDQISLFD